MTAPPDAPKQQAANPPSSLNVIQKTFRTEALARIQRGMPSFQTMSVGFRLPSPTRRFNSFIVTGSICFPSQV